MLYAIQYGVTTKKEKFIWHELICQIRIDTKNVKELVMTTTG